MRGEEFEALVNDIKKKNLILPIILYDGTIVDGKNRYRACLKINVAPMFIDYKGKLSAIDLVTSLNGIRRSDSPAAKAEIAKRIMEFLEDQEEEAKIEEALKLEDEPTAEKIRIVREKKKMMRAAEMAGTTAEKMKQRKVIEGIAEQDLDIKGLLRDAEKGKVSMDSVYRQAIKKQEIRARGKAESEVSDESPVEDTRPVLVQVNEKLRAKIKGIREEVTEWKGKYHNLKAVYESLEQKHADLKNRLKTLFESAGLETTSAKENNEFPQVKDLRKAELKY